MVVDERRIGLLLSQTIFIIYERENNLHLMVQKGIISFSFERNHETIINQGNFILIFTAY